ncbi:MAG: hypothetical protein JXB13_15270 [Phycisphaerae bacterium]|nr:hypothetical protein [Phycisphaerae bacterium]
MTRSILAALAVVAGVTLGLTGPPAWAQTGGDDAPEVIIFRGDEMKVWPFEELRSRGYDVVEPPREENAFWVCLEAINAYKDVPKELQEAFDYALTATWPKGHDEALKSFLMDPANQQALAAARRAAKMETFQSYYFGDPKGSIISILLPSLSTHRQLCKMLIVDGRRLEAEGAYDRAFENYVAVMRLGSHVGGGITLIENLVGVACWSLGDRAACQLGLREGIPASQLREMLKTLKELAARRPTVERGLYYERMFGGGMVDEIVTKPTRLFQNLNGIMGMYGDYEINREETGWEKLEARVGRLMLPDRTIKQHFNEFYDRQYELTQNPAYSETWTSFDEEKAVMSIPQWDIFARMLLPSLTRACTISERLRAQSLLTRIAIALRLHVLENKGQPAESLSSLDPAVPADDRIDPFSGKEFKYKVDGKGWTLYSVAENRVDDGGKTESGRLWDLDYVLQFPTPDAKPFEPTETSNE